jgi:hypothetical protein
MKMPNIRKLTPLNKDEFIRPLEELSESERESIYWCDLADSTL